MNCDYCQQAIEPTDTVCPNCQTAVPIQAGIVETSPGNNPYATPNTTAAKVPPNLHGEGDSTGGIIPYKNPKALLAYYLGIVSGLPLIGFPFAVAAFILGIMGLRDRKRNPVIKGSIHAWVGIGCGGLFTLFWGFVILAIMVSLISGV